jgi:acetylornithine deacetylase/succinyl-diaminopimelate desuccinylase-like protein
MDVAPAGNFFDWKHPTFYGYEEGDFLYGRGACEEMLQMIGEWY